MGCRKMRELRLLRRRMPARCLCPGKRQNAPCGSRRLYGMRRVRSKLPGERHFRPIRRRMRSGGAQHHDRAFGRRLLQPGFGLLLSHAAALGRFAGRNGGRRSWRCRPAMIRLRRKAPRALSTERRDTIPCHSKRRTPCRRTNTNVSPAKRNSPPFRAFRNMERTQSNARNAKAPRSSSSCPSSRRKRVRKAEPAGFPAKRRRLRAPSFFAGRIVPGGGVEVSEASPDQHHAGGPTTADRGTAEQRRMKTGRFKRPLFDFHQNLSGLEALFAFRGVHWRIRGSTRGVSRAMVDVPVRGHRICWCDLRCRSRSCRIRLP